MRYMNTIGTFVQPPYIFHQKRFLNELMDAPTSSKLFCRENDQEIKTWLWQTPGTVVTYFQIGCLFRNEFFISFCG